MSGVDVLVAGGGPAGAALAALVAGTGARVLLFEREAFPRDKVCGEFLSAEARPVLAELDVDAGGGAEISAMRITTPAGRALDGALPAPALGLSRARLDAALLDAARRRGAVVRERCEAVGPVLEDGRVAGLRLRDVGASGPGREIRARVVVAADGRRSALARALHPALGDPARTGPGSLFGLKRHYAAPRGILGGRVELHLFDGGYAGLAEVEGDRLNLCLVTTVGALRAAGSPDALAAFRLRRNPALAAALDAAVPAGPWHAVGPLRFAPRRPAARGALFVGDAAGTVDPFSGEGMAHALLGARAAAPFVLAAAARGGLDAPLSRAWTAAWTRMFRRAGRRARVMGPLFLRPRLAGAALAVLARSPRRVVSGIVSGTRVPAP